MVDIEECQDPDHPISSEIMVRIPEQYSLQNVVKEHRAHVMFLVSKIAKSGWAGKLSLVVNDCTDFEERWTTPRSLVPQTRAQSVRYWALEANIAITCVALIQHYSTYKDELEGGIMP